MTVRVGFLGAGLIASFHSKMLRGSGEDVGWAGVFDPDPTRTVAFARASGATPCTSEDEVLDGCDAVYVCTWTAEHLRLVTAAAERGLAVFCEKPLSTDLAGATELAAVVRDAGIVNQVGLILRRSPAFNLVRDIVADPRSGRVMTVIFRDDQYIPVQGMYGSTWRGDRSLAGSGTLLEHSIHDVDILEHMVGPVESVSARSGDFHGLDGIEDAVATILGFAGGAVGTVASVWHDVLARPSLRRVEIFCERTWIALEGDWLGPVTWTRDVAMPDGGMPDVSAHSASETVTVEGADLVAECERRQIAMPNADGCFIRSVRYGTPAAPDVEVALRAHVLVDAIYESARKGGAAIPIDVGS